MAGKSRSDRLAETQQKIADEMIEVEMLKDELENWLDNMPENLQGGEKAEQLQEAIDNLQEIYDSLETATTTEVEFPGMFG